MLKEGDKAPDFTAKDDSGKTLSLKDFRGKNVVLYFYPKDMTTACTQEACDFRDNMARVKRKGAVVLGVSPDSETRHAKFRDKYELSFPLLADEELKIVNAYGVWKEKSMYGRKFMGVERTTFIIDDKGKIAKIFPKVRVAGHVDQVIEALGTL
jgi:peroxiredoxin Q/BCP